MTAFDVNIGVVGALWVLAAWGGTTRKHQLPVSMVMLAAIVGVGLFRGVVFASDLAELHVLTGLDGAVLRLVLWGLLGAAAARVGWRESSRWAPVVFGLVCGELGGAVLAAAGVSDPRVTARRVMAASAGALMSRVADPAVWLLVDGVPGLHTDGWGTTGLETWGLLALAALLGVIIASPPAVDGMDTERPSLVLGVGAMVWLASWMPVAQLPAVAIGAAVLWLQTRARADEGVLVRPALLVVGGLVAVSAGLTEEWASLLEARLIDMEGSFPVLVWAAGAVSGLVLGSDGGGLAGRAVLDRALAVHTPMAPGLWALGAAVAGLGPHIVTGTVWRGLPRHAVWVAGCGAMVWGAHTLGWMVP